MNRIIATCRSPRAEVVETPQGYRSRVKVTRTSWMESAAYARPDDAMAVCRTYIREASFGKVDACKALKPVNA